MSVLLQTQSSYYHLMPNPIAIAIITIIHTTDISIKSIPALFLKATTNSLMVYL